MDKLQKGIKLGMRQILFPIFRVDNANNPDDKKKI
jgi:hypothetical protein